MSENGEIYTAGKNFTLHAAVQDYFLIHCRTRVSRIIFKLTVARGGPGLFSIWLSHAESRSMIDTVDTVDTVDTYDTVDTIEH